MTTTSTAVGISHIHRHLQLVYSILHYIVNMCIDVVNLAPDVCNLISVSQCVM